MPVCPGCESRDVRRSRHRRALHFVQHWRGMRMYRCNECRRNFYAPRPVDMAVNRPKRPRRDTGKRQRWGFELLFFLVMVAVFYSILRFVARIK